MSAKFKVAVGGFHHETNTFAPSKARLEDFERAGGWPGLTRGPALFEAVAGINIPIAGFLERASDLTLRTNQFHANARRLTVPQLRAELQEGAKGFLVRVADRFGDYGIVGLVLYRPGSDGIEAPTFLLSCRALGRGVEHRMMQRLGAMALEDQVVERLLEKADITEDTLSFRELMNLDD